MILKLSKKANPIRAFFDAGVTKLREEWQIAKEIPEKLISYKTKCLNIWVQAKDNGYMDMAKWKACEVSDLPIDVHGQPVYVGFDMSAKIDLTSVAFVIPYQTDQVDVHGKLVVRYIVFSHSFIPSREKLREHILKDQGSLRRLGADGVSGSDEYSDCGPRRRHGICFENMRSVWVENPVPMF